MTAAQHTPIAARRGLTAMMVAALLCITGCASISNMEENVQDPGTSYRPSNFHCEYPAIPPEIRRVALLPVTITSRDTFLETGAETLEPLLYTELIKTKRFEIIPVTREQLQALTGRLGWKTDEELPTDFFKKLQKATACDAVMFAQLTRFKPYQPISVGWKLNLIQTAATVIPDPVPSAASTSPIVAVRVKTFWSIDEVLDSGDPSIALASRRYYREHLRNEAPAADVSTMTSSPARFGQYSLYALLSTLPERELRRN